MLHFKSMDILASWLLDSNFMELSGESYIFTKETPDCNPAQIYARLSRLVQEGFLACISIISRNPHIFKERIGGE